MAALASPEALDELLTLACAAHFDAGASGALARAGQAAKAIEHASRASEALVKVCQGLQALGAQDLNPLVKPAPVNPLAELARVENSRAEAMALLDALHHALQLAEALDEKRGDTGGDWEERLLHAVCGLELELFGPSDRVTGARE